MSRLEIILLVAILGFSMSKKRNLGLRKFQWFKVSKLNSETRSQYSNLRKSKDFVNNSNHYNYKIRKSISHLFHFHNPASDMEEKSQYKFYLLKMLENESEICDGNDNLFRVDRTLDDKVDATLRDEAVKHLLVMNKVYFELPFEILCSAIQLIDRFISRVKVKPKYMFCASAVCYQMIVKQYDPNLIYSTIMADLPSISRSGGTHSDLIRMEDIIRTKLYNQLHTITVFDFVDAIINYLLINQDYSVAIIKLLEPIIETAIINYSSGHQKPSILAIVCILVYNNFYPHQPICSPWSLLHLSTIFKHDWSVIYNYANLVTELHSNRFNQIDYRRQFGVCSRKPGNLYNSIKHKLDTIVEE